jgi:hypothetical protein
MNDFAELKEKAKLLGSAPQTPSNPYWTLVQTSWRGVIMAGHRCTLLLRLAPLQ